MNKRGQVWVRSQQGCSHVHALSRLLLLEETMNFEPIGTSSVSGAAFRHSDQKTFSKAASFASCPILLVDDTFSVVLAFGD